MEYFAVAVFALFMHSLWQFGIMAFVPLGLVGMEYMPQTDESSFTINIQADPGSSAEQTNAVAKRIEEKLAEIPEVKYYLTHAGGSSANEGRIKVQLYDRQERSRSVWAVANGAQRFRRLPKQESTP